VVTEQLSRLCRTSHRSVSWTRCAPARHADADGIRAWSVFTPATDQWTHLVGVYDAPDGQMLLYVNGALEGTATDNTPFAGNGGIVIGRAEDNGQRVDWFPGTITDVEVFQQALTPGQVGALSGP
jgi:large repetitive protein